MPEKNLSGAPTLEKRDRRLSLATVVRRFGDDSGAVRVVLHVRTHGAMYVAAMRCRDGLRGAGVQN